MDAAGEARPVFHGGADLFDSARAETRDSDPARLSRERTERRRSRIENFGIAAPLETGVNLPLLMLLLHQDPDRSSIRTPIGLEVPSPKCVSSVETFCKYTVCWILCWLYDYILSLKSHMEN